MHAPRQHGQPRAEGPPLADLRGTERIKDYTSQFHYGAHDAGHFTVSYSELHRWVRRPGLESDYHMLMPMEFHADTTQLVQMLRKGHHQVKLNEDAWDRLITWIDFNAPFHGTWTEIAGKERVEYPAKRRLELLQRYAGMDTDPGTDSKFKFFHILYRVLSTQLFQCRQNTFGKNIRPVKSVTFCPHR